jgi:hypothetical protein
MTLPRLGSRVRIPSPAPIFLKEIRCLERSLGAVFCFLDPSAKPGEAAESVKRRVAGCLRQGWRPEAKISRLRAKLRQGPTHSVAKGLVGQRHASSDAEPSRFMLPRFPSRDALGLMIKVLRSVSHSASPRSQPGRSIDYGICTDVDIWVGSPLGEEPRAYLEAGYYLLESLTDPLGRLFQERVVNRQHRGDRVDRRDFDGVVRRLLNHDIAREHGSNLVLEV